MSERLKTYKFYLNLKRMILTIFHHSRYSNMRNSIMSNMRVAGFELSFYSGVYSSCIGFTKELGDSAKTLVGMSGIFIGVGEVLGEFPCRMESYLITFVSL